MTLETNEMLQVRTLVEPRLEGKTLRGFIVDVDVKESEIVAILR